MEASCLVQLYECNRTRESRIMILFTCSLFMILEPGGPAPLVTCCGTIRSSTCENHTYHLSHGTIRSSTWKESIQMSHHWSLWFARSALLCLSYFKITCFDMIRRPRICVMNESSSLGESISAWSLVTRLLPKNTCNCKLLMRTSTHATPIPPNG